jgi:hypothetical protein
LEIFATGLTAFLEGFLVVLLATTALGDDFAAFEGALALGFRTGSDLAAFLEGATTGALVAFPGLSFALIRAVRLTMMTFLAWADFKPLSSPQIGPERVSANYGTVFPRQPYITGFSRDYSADSSP